MNEKLLIQGIRWMPTVTTDEINTLRKKMLEEDSKELFLMTYANDPTLIVGMVLRKYDTPALSLAPCIREKEEMGDFCFFCFRRTGLTSFMRHISRCFFPSVPRNPEDFYAEADQPAEKPLPHFPTQTPGTKPYNPFLAFLQSKTPALIEEALNQRVIGQPELTKAVADFLYYHALRQLHPQLPQRPLLVAGPSGSGKTEVWRAATDLYGHIFPIRIIDGSNISGEGWSGNYKIDTYLDERITNGGILVIDEFDKLVTPKHTSSGDNVSMNMQAEFLKLVEGEYQVSKQKALTGMTSKKMGFAMLGAFEELWERRKKQRTKQTGSIGFCSQSTTPTEGPADTALTDEDFIRFGMMPELLGRIAVKCATKALDAKTYLDILRGPHSRVALIEQVLEQYGIHIQNVISDEEILNLVETSRNNRTGVRWVSAQVENRLLDAIRQKGLFPAAIEKCA